METSNSNDEDVYSYFSEYYKNVSIILMFTYEVFFSCAKKFETHHNIHIIVSFDVEHNAET